MPLVESADLSINVHEHSASGPGKPHLVLVHGYPDQQDMWDLVVGELDLDELHVITYDVRGAGGSDVPLSVDGYRTELLTEDLIAVTGATVPDGEPFHLVGHDWGSVQLWDVVAAERSDARLTGRIASFTSVSGPSLDHVAHLMRNRRGRRLGLFRQGIRSWYVYLFQLPVLPELLWSAGHRLFSRSTGGHWGSELSRNARNGLNLYRANVRRRMITPDRLETTVPVQVVVPSRDTFLSRVLVEDLDQSCTDLPVVDIDAGHWVPRTRPGDVAGLVTSHVLAHARP